MKSQNAKILNYLKTKKPLTTKDAQETKKVGNAVIAEYRYAS